MWSYNSTVRHDAFTTESRRNLAERGLAMPDGSYPIRNVSDLKNAIQSYGRAKNKDAVKAWIKKRAKALNAESLLPEDWRDGELTHYGIKGMKWGVRRYQNKDGTLTAAGKNRYNENYSDKQRKQDRAIYGKRAEKRINRRMNEGYGIKGARAFEADRKARKENRGRVMRKTISAVSTAVGIAYFADQAFNNGVGTEAVGKVAQSTIDAARRWLDKH